jgi:hypothetical protein
MVILILLLKVSIQMPVQIVKIKTRMTNLSLGLVRKSMQELPMMIILLLSIRIWILPIRIRISRVSIKCYKLISNLLTIIKVMLWIIIIIILGITIINNLHLVISKTLSNKIRTTSWIVIWTTIIWAIILTNSQFTIIRWIIINSIKFNIDCFLF